MSPSPAPRSVGRRDWQAEYSALAELDCTGGLSPEDLEQMAVAAFMLGRDADVITFRERAHEAYLARGAFEQALRCGFWIGFHLQNRGEMAQAAGWRVRLGRLLEQRPESGFAVWFTMPDAVQAMFSGDAVTALPVFERVSQVADAATDPDFFVLAALGRGRCLDLLGRAAEAAALLDEAMLHVVSGSVAPQVSGLAYCAVVAMCMERFDLARAQEWTAALSRWVDEQSDLVPYRGVCLVHRAELLQLRGSWSEAAEEAERACHWLAESQESALGSAFYRVAELARLRGELDRAESAYQQASAAGFEVQPGLARVRLAQGNADVAAAGLDRALAELAGPQLPARGPLLAARIDVALANHDFEIAARYADELSQVALRWGAPYLSALAEQCAGAVLLATGEPSAALLRLRAADTLWHQIDAPYELAMLRLLFAQACTQLADVDAAAMATASARAALERLGAAGALAALEGGEQPVGGDGRGLLTARELQVLRLLATGATNRAIAGRLVISEKTVARHLSNIFAKLDLPSRAAATAYAYEHGLA